MNVRRPEWDEQPSRRRARYAVENQTTILSGFIGPPRSDRTTGPVPTVMSRPDSEGVPQLRVQRDPSSASIFRSVISQLNGATYLAIRIEDHVPGQFCNLAGPQPGLCGQQHDDLVSDGMPGTFGVDKEIFYIVFGYRFRLLAEHISHRDQIFDSS
jgi:hypothetical protein